MRPRISAVTWCCAGSGGATLTPLTATPITDLRYRDDTVKSGVRYVYAIVAVDKAGNRSEESNRAEETAHSGQVRHQ